MGRSAVHTPFALTPLTNCPGLAEVSHQGGPQLGQVPGQDSGLQTEGRKQVGAAGPYPVPCSAPLSHEQQVGAPVARVSPCAPWGSIRPHWST